MARRRGAHQERAVRKAKADRHKQKDELASHLEKVKDELKGVEATHPQLVAAVNGLCEFLARAGI